MMPSDRDEDFDMPLWKIVVKHLLSPRTWIYPIIILIIAFFVLPRLNRQAAPPKGADGGTVLFGTEDRNPGTSQTVDREGNIHRFTVPQTGK